MFNYFVVKFGLVYIIDLILGDLRWLYYFVIIIGKLISFLEKILYKVKNKIFLGVILNILILSIIFIVFLFLVRIGYVIEIFFFFIIFVIKSLVDEGKKVYRILKLGDIEKVKKELLYFVSRDINILLFDKIIMSVVEIIVENIVDGFIFLVFFVFVGSFFYVELFGKVVFFVLFFVMIYKVINILDFMVGYKNEKYIDFGKVFVRVDDIVNFIFVRFIGLIFVFLLSLILGYNFKNFLKIFFRDRKKYLSLNFG